MTIIFKNTSFMINVGISYSDKWFILENNRLKLFNCLPVSIKHYKADTFLIKIEDNFLFKEIRELKLFLVKYASDNTFETT